MGFGCLWAKTNLDEGGERLAEGERDRRKKHRKKPKTQIDAD